MTEIITWELVAERINSDLANTLGNLVNRTISMSNKYFGGVVEIGMSADRASAVDDDLKTDCDRHLCKSWQPKWKNLRVADALTEIFGIFKRCNKYIDETEPWVLAKDEAKAGPSGHRSLQSGGKHCHRRIPAVEPYMPETAEKICKAAEYRSCGSFDTAGAVRPV